MRRALLALFLTPAFLSAVFGVFALVIFPFMFVVTLVVALPLFLLLKNLRTLSWWHALIAGAFCGLFFVAFDTSLSHTFNPDHLINSTNFFYVSYGAIIGFTFWWTGVFRNAAFPFVSRTVPLGVVVVIPLAIVGVYVYQSLHANFHEGRVISVVKYPGKSGEVGEATVRLKSGSTVAAFFGNTWPIAMVENRCFHVTERWSTFRFRRIHELLVPFGGDAENC